MKRLYLIILILAGMTLMLPGAGRAADSVYYPSYYHLRQGTTIIVALLQNLTSGKSAGGMISRYITAAFIRGGRFRVYRQNMFRSFMARAGIAQRFPVDRSIAMKIGRLAGANYVVFGSVVEYDYLATPGGTGTFPVIGINVRIVDTGTGGIIFAGSLIKKGGTGDSLESLALRMAKSFYERTEQ